MSHEIGTHRGQGRSGADVIARDGDNVQVRLGLVDGNLFRDTPALQDVTHCSVRVGGHVTDDSFVDLGLFLNKENDEKHKQNGTSLDARWKEKERKTENNMEKTVESEMKTMQHSWGSLTRLAQDRQ